MPKHFSVLLNTDWQLLSILNHQNWYNNRRWFILTNNVVHHYNQIIQADFGLVVNFHYTSSLPCLETVQDACCCWMRSSICSGSASISSICQLLRISPSQQGCFAACCYLDEQLSRHTFFFSRLNDNCVVFLQLQLLTGAAGCQLLLSARRRKWTLWSSAEQMNLNQNFRMSFS